MSTVSIHVRTTKVDGKFLDFVVTDKASKYVKRVRAKDVTEMINSAKRAQSEAMGSSLRIAMLDLDSAYRNGKVLAKDWKLVAKKIYGCARVGV